MAKAQCGGQRSALAQSAHQDQDHGQRQSGNERGNSQVVRRRSGCGHTNASSTE